MTEKRFGVITNWCIYENVDGIEKWLNFNEVVVLLNNLNDENEQLKQRNDRQADSLGRLYKLIEQKDWRALSDIMDDFKRCDEQLQREWGTYGDVE